MTSERSTGTFSSALNPDWISHRPILDRLSYAHQPRKIVARVEGWSYALRGNGIGASGLRRTEHCRR